MSPLPRRTLASVLLRSLLIQGSWNYRTMQGSGFAFALLPALRRLYGGDPETLQEAMRRHREHFNAHPYLVGVALGAVLRLEAQGEDPETIRRLKLAVRGPLGGLGDALVWATLLPGASVLALSMLWLGAPPWVGVSVFLIVFNGGHLALRVWGFRAGLRAGRDVGRVLGEADLAGWTSRIRPAVAGLLGLLAGAVAAADGGLSDAGAPWLALGVGGFLVGLLGGHRTWRPAAVVVVVAIGVVAVIGATT